MGDTETIVEEISYSPEEQEEIDRILGVIEDLEFQAQPEPEGTSEPEPDGEPDLDYALDDDLSGDEFRDEVPEEFAVGEDITVSAPPEDVYFEEPENLDLPSDPLGSIGEDTSISDFPDEDIDSGVPDELLDGFDDVEELTPDMLQEIPDEGDAGVEDISDLLEEVGEAESDVETLPDDALTALDETFEEDDSLSDVDFGDLEEPVGDEAPEILTTGSTIDQLNSLTASEPETLDIQDMASEDEFIGDEDLDTTEVEESVSELPDDIPAFDDEASEDFDLDDIGGIEDSGEMELPGDDAGISLEKDVDVDIPDLSDITDISDAGDIGEADDTDIPDIDLGDIGLGEDEPIDKQLDAIDDFSDDEFPDLDDLAPVDDGTMDEPVMDAGFDDDAGLGEIESIDEEPLAVEEDHFEIEPIDDIEELEVEPLDDIPEETMEYSGKSSTASEGDDIELSDKELNRLKKAILLFDPGLRQAIKDAVVQDLLPVKETRQMVDMILAGKPEDNIHRFLEKKLGRSIEHIGEDRGGHRVITSRPEYTQEGRERQKRLLKVTKIVAASATVTCLFAIFGYVFIYTPYRAKSLFDQGAEIILQKGDYVQKPQDYQKAENIFDEAVEEFVYPFPSKDFGANIDELVYGYNVYGRAYFDVKENDLALKKLNSAYRERYDAGSEVDVSTLNNLGYFYSRVPKEYYAKVMGKVDQWYYTNLAEQKGIRSQLDVAIEFYKQTLLQDDRNQEAMFGIGNAYYYQGQYLKAKKYYEDILKIDPDSVIGYSGLLNLYIERDAFEQVVSIDSELRGKEMLSSVPKALLAKLAGFYMDKIATEDDNIRIAYGVQSARFKDMDDQPYPAVRAVLAALNEQDSEYPPLQLQYARLSKLQDNYPVMKRYLDKAISASPNYFDALHLMGEYYYDIKQPVEAYNYLRQAIDSHSRQPNFTHDDFYQPMENVGHSNALLGNIFYYFFDKVSNRFGDLEADDSNTSETRIENMSFARQRYETAIEEGYESSEVHYNLGRIFYDQKLYREALEQWLYLYEDFVNKPELMFALGNAFYHEGKYDASRGEYLKLISIFEYDAEKITKPQAGEESHVRIFQTLASSYNNLGAVYQQQKDESKSDISYWKAVEYSKRINRENEYARVNLARSFKGERVVQPILDEAIPYSIEAYRDVQK